MRPEDRHAARSGASSSTLAPGGRLDVRLFARHYHNFENARERHNHHSRHNRHISHDHSLDIGEILLREIGQIHEVSGLDRRQFKAQCVLGRHAETTDGGAGGAEVEEGKGARKRAREGGKSATKGRRGKAEEGGEGREGKAERGEETRQGREEAGEERGESQEEGGRGGSQGFEVKSGGWIKTISRSGQRCMLHFVAIDHTLTYARPSYQDIKSR